MKKIITIAIVLCSLVSHAQVNNIYVKATYDTTALKAFLDNIYLKIPDSINMRARLIAGTNITITGTYPNQTISASGGGGGVTSFNSRTGAVTPQAGDYNSITETLSSKTIDAGSNTITGLTNSNLSGSAGITNANLANSTISGRSLGTNLLNLTLGVGLTGSSYNGSASITTSIDTATTIQGKAAAAATYFPLQGGSLTGTGGAGFVGFPTQTTAPTGTAGLVKIYSDANGRFSWITGLNFSRTFASYSLTGNRVYRMYDRDYTFADSADLSNGLLLKVNNTDTVRFVNTGNVNQTILGVKTFTTAATTPTQIISTSASATRESFYP